MVAFLVFCLVMFAWAWTAEYSVAPGLEEIQSARRIAANMRQLRTNLAKAENDEEAEPIRAALERQRQLRLDNLVEGILRLAAALMILIIGLVMLFVALPAWKVLAILLGFACLGVARWLTRHYRQLRAEWRRRAVPPRTMEGGHGREVLMNLVGIIALPIVGVLLLLSVV